MSTPRLSVVILTLNEEVNLGACLGSLRGLDGEVCVVDSGSNDRTVAIAREHGASVSQHAFENYAAQRNWAQAHVARGEWVLHLDADERLTPALVAEMRALLENPPQDVDGFLLCKRTIFMGRWIRHGGHYPSYHLRLFRKERGQCEDRRYDQHFLVEGRVRKLSNDYRDVVMTDLDRWVSRHLRWARLEARETATSSASANRVQPNFAGNPIERKRWFRERVYGRLPLFLRPFLYWFYRYFIRLGFLDGTEGLIFHFLHAGWFRFLVDVRIHELRKERKAG